MFVAQVGVTLDQKFKKQINLNQKRKIDGKLKTISVTDQEEKKNGKHKRKLNRTLSVSKCVFCLFKLYVYEKNHQWNIIQA